MDAAKDILHQYMALAVDGKPPMGEGTTHLDHKRVVFSGQPDAPGTVLGPTPPKGYVWVEWDEGMIGLHQIGYLKEVEDA